jgi:hypothetical protein
MLAIPRGTRLKQPAWAGRRLRYWSAAGNDHGRTVVRAVSVWRGHLATTPAWSRLPAVRDLGDRLPAAARALPGSSV